MKVHFLLLVKLIHPITKEPIAEGTVIEREIIHGNSVRKDEVAVSVKRIIGFNSIKQPEFKYFVEAGGFTVWKKALCQQQQ